MSIAINSNQASTRASLNMKRVSDRLGKSLNRLSSGMRITSPGEDAGGLAVGMKLQSTLRRAQASMQNTMNGISFLQMQDSVLKVAGDIIDRMSELKSFFNDVSKNALDRETYNHEFHELQKELSSLKRQKFNGVSLFASREPDNNPMKIITSDDGLGEHIELNRLGLFENLKSKFGADGQLNSGSHGEYRQLVGEFSKDGGTTDAILGKTSRDYSAGEVVFMQKSGGESGYFMALTDVASGVDIEDTRKPTTKWIRIADESGSGFAESYPDASIYDHTSSKYNAEGNRVAYLKGDIVKVEAHWSSPGSYIFLKAQNDVPRNIQVSDLFSRDYVGENGYFDYVGQDTVADAYGQNKPTTTFVRANSDLPSPSSFATTAELISLLKENVSNGYMPDYVLSNTNGGIYRPSSDWGLSRWDSTLPFNEGALVLDEDNSTILRLGSDVKGQWTDKGYSEDDLVFNGGEWFQASADTTQGDILNVPFSSSTAAFDGSTPYEGGDAILSGGQILIANQNVKGEFTATKSYDANDVIKDGSGWTQITNKHHGDWDSSLTIANNETVEYNGNLFQNTSGGDLTGFPVPTAGANWTLLGTGLSNLAGSPISDLDLESNHFTASLWQSADPTDPTVASVTDVTSDLENLDDTSYWAKTHFGSLNGLTVDTNYTYGDNIHYQGKHYVYVSHLDSNDPLYVSPGNDGYTEFDDLLRAGAVMELPMYVDTIGAGGSSSTPGDVYYKPNQALEYVDRLPNSGLVRSNGAVRMTDSPLPPGDEIHGSADDHFYSGLNAGNDGIYGTMDDFYSSTIDPTLAVSGGQIDADADNNKDLLNTSFGLEDFSVADFVDYIQSVANFRAINGGIMSRLNYATNILEENQVNLEAATSRIMDVDMAKESAKLAQYSVKLQASASMIVQANQLNQVVLQLLQ